MKIKKFVKSTIIIYFTSALISSSFALELVIPPQNTVVHPGDTITIKVVPSAGEKVGSIFFGGFESEVSAPPYEYKYKIGPQDIGEITLSIFAIKPESEGPFASADDAFSSSLDLHLKSTLPATVTLQKLRIDNDQKTLFLRVSKKEKIYVFGLYSDSIERDVSFSTAGTSYTSSNEKVITVDADGLSTAVGPGAAQITISNGDKKLVIDVTVQPKL